MSNPARRQVDLTKDDPAEALIELGRRLHVTDMHLVGLIAQRIHLARMVEYAKGRQATPEKPLGADIFRAEIETKRLAEVRQAAESFGINPELAVALLYFLIGDSCKAQMIQRESGGSDYDQVGYDQLKANLIALTDAVATTYDKRYASGYPATEDYLAYELEVVAREIEAVDGRGLALDLGCGTGRLARALSEHFDEVIGIDLSAPMVDEAAKQAYAKHITNIGYRCNDLEDPGAWESIQDGSVDFVTMGFGAASDIKEIGFVIRQIKRVLKSGGRCVLSFYNAGALVYQGEFFPWPDSLAAVVDLSRHCLDVHHGTKTYALYARAYTWDEVDTLFGRGLAVAHQQSYPAFAPVMPREILRNPVMREAIGQLDRERALSHEDGAYILATGRRT